MHTNDIAFGLYFHDHERCWFLRSPWDHLRIAKVVSGSDLMTVLLITLVPLKDQTEHSIVVT